MVLLAIVVATLAAGIGSVWLAELSLRLGLGGNGRVGPQHLLSLAAGALLATAFMHLLPEAFEDGASVQPLFATLLVGLVFFFLLEKAELWHHGHENAAGGIHHGHSHGHAHEHEHQHHGHRHGHGGWTLLTGDSVHCFGDGVLIASAFMADLHLGLVAALSVLAHEVPHHVGDLIVLRQRGAARSVALLKVSLAGAVSVLGGLVGYFLIGHWQGALPYFLVVASSSFIYVALADLIPQLQRRLPAAQAALQVAWLIVGITLVTLASYLAHHLEH
ncbi:ZIP family metal transporter [Melaminivora jejuensis]|uniref:ZIP family metal transporter n=1 Tax=Melaminivora jejuensis TaxID=1267217 RepID=UPI001AE04EB3|nr:ZIP family metal transporter [Melaminivora jejuensis]UHJ66004.1 ZIP family metal transporter [Melaminivora jejuensis]